MRHEIQAEINVTPLVDVCLVLLIIFMVVTPLITGGPVELPQGPSPKPWPAEPARSRVTLAYGPPPAISLDNDPGPLSQPAFEELIRALHEQNPSREIVLRADRRLSYGEVKRVIRSVQAAGFPSIGLVAALAARAVAAPSRLLKKGVGWRYERRGSDARKRDDGDAGGIGEER